MENLRVKFVDFWMEMNQPEGNIFYPALSKKYDVEFSDDPEILFYSCYGNEYLKYSCTRIFYSAENKRPDFSETDFAITFDRLNDHRHLRMPLWALYYKDEVVKKNSADEIFQEWANRKNFCCIVVSNELAKERINFFKKLNAIIKVDSAGKWNNTIGKTIPSGTENKLAFIKDYRFVISFENSSYPGYTTEKIIEPLMAGCIPIYWGDPEIFSDFNSKRFLNVKNENDFDDAIKKILAIEDDRSIARSVLQEPIFANNKTPVYLEKDYLEKKIISWIEEARAKNFKGVGSEIKQRIKYFSELCKGKLRAVKNKMAQ
jgi:alpha(1,3/1,4) fucosyltransferase